jgi:hypothetical protein
LHFRLKIVDKELTKTKAIAINAELKNQFGVTEFMMS